MQMAGVRGVNVGNVVEKNGQQNLLYKLQDVTLHITRDADIVNKRQVDLGHYAW